MQKIIPSIFIGLCFLIALPAAAANYYVDGDNGSDGAGDGSSSSPYATISQALTAISGGDTIYCKGSITDTITLNAGHSGTANANTTITAWPDNSATIDGNGADYLFTINNNAQYISIQNLAFSSAAKRFFYSANNSNYITIANNEFSGLTAGNDTTAINLANSDNLVISGNDFNGDDQESYAIDLDTCQQTTIENNAIYNYTKDGIIINTDSSDSDIKNNIIYNIGDSSYYYSAGIIVADSSDIRVINNTIFNTYNDTQEVSGIMLMTSSSTLYDVTIENNIISQANYAINIDSFYNGVDIDYNDYYQVNKLASAQGVDYDTLAEWQAATDYDEHSFSSDPLFVSTTVGSEDFHISASSPCVDTGTLNVSINSDYDGETRPYTSTDIGADEDQTPDAPTDLTASNITVSSTDLTWTAASKDITSYILEYDTNENFVTAVQVTDLSTTSSSLENLTTNTSYYVRVASVNETAYTTYTSNYTELTSAFTTIPNSPSNLQTTDRKVKKLSLAWDAPLSGASNYQIEYADNSNYTNSTSTTSDATNITLTGLKTSKKHYFKVSACNSNSVCGDTISDSARTKPKKVKYLKILKKKTLTNNQVKIRWQRQPRVEKYKIKLTHKTKTNKTKTKYITIKNNKFNKKVKNKAGKTIKIKRKLLKKLNSNTKYTVKIRAIFNKNNKGKYSKSKKFTTKL